MSEIVYLRALEVSDLDRINKWHNDRDLYELLGGPFRFVSRRATLTWLENKSGFESYSCDEVKLAICVKASDQHVGNVYLHEINWTVRHGRLEVFIGDNRERSKGYGQSAIRQMLSYAFYDLGLKRVYLGVLPDNLAAIHTYEKIGFKAEGTLRNHIFKQGYWKDVLFMGIHTEDWPALGRDDEDSGQPSVADKTCPDRKTPDEGDHR